MIHSSEFLELVEESRARIREISVEQTLARLGQGAVLIDVREDREWAEAHAAGSRHMGRGVIERDAVQSFPDKSVELILYCGGGYRSALAADNLQKMGFERVFSMLGGWSAWKDSGAPVEETAI
jgi:rhodanese-related sulfurtransferase